jgi:hypothetical protein
MLADGSFALLRSLYPMNKIEILACVAPKRREPRAAEGQRSEGNKEFPSINN